MQRSVFFISDRTGITVETLGHSLLTQFGDIQFTIQTLRFIDNDLKVRAAVDSINHSAADTGQRPIVFSTLIDAPLRRQIAASNCVFFDIVDTFIHPLENELGHSSSHTIGQSHGLTDTGRYNLRMDAVNFSLATDDGQSTHDYSQADVIILGVSRSGKTPTCLYLALTYGIYAANYPLTPEDLEDLRLPPAIASLRDKLFGLHIDAQRLHQIRQRRRPDSQYASLRQCQTELRQAEALYRKFGIASLSSTAMSVEEIATTILHQMKLKPRRT
jgi:regulator of PEP synthase PpsR (kinase-PPPase family)